LTKNSKLKIKNYFKGFTMIEAVVALAILSLLFVGFINVTAVGIKSFRNSKEKYLAAKIAQEGMELMINKRDNNIICVSTACGPVNDWKDNLTGSWQVEAQRVSDLAPSGKFSNFSDSNYICWNDSGLTTGQFSYCGDPQKYVPGQFTREVNVTTINNNILLVKSIVKWQTPGVTSLTHEFILEETLFGSNP